MATGPVATFPWGWERVWRRQEGLRCTQHASPSASTAIHYIKAFIFFFFVVVDITFSFTFSCCAGPADLCTGCFFILVYCVPVFVRESRWVEKASFPISHSWQAVWLRIDARCWLSVGVGGTRDRDRWWHAGACQLKTQWPEWEVMLSSSEKLPFTFSKGGTWGNGCLVEYIFVFVFAFCRQSL